MVFSVNFFSKFLEILVKNNKIKGFFYRKSIKFKRLKEAIIFEIFSVNTRENLDTKCKIFLSNMQLFC